MTHHISTDLRTVVLELNGLQWASEKITAEAVLRAQPGVESAVVNPVAQTATVSFDPARTTIAELAGWITECGYHCRGESVSDHLCPPPAPGVRSADYVNPESAASRSGQANGPAEQGATTTDHR